MEPLILTIVTLLVFSGFALCCAGSLALLPGALLIAAGVALHRLAAKYNIIKEPAE